MSRQRLSITVNSSWPEVISNTLMPPGLPALIVDERTCAMFFILFTRRNKSCLPYSFPLNVAIYAHSFNLSILCSSHSGCGRFVQIIAFPFSKCNRPALMFSALEKDDFSSRRARAFLFGQMQQKAADTPCKNK